MLLLNIFEIIGTVAFSISGTLVGMQKKLDLFGVVILAFITALGGGLFRDIILGNIPPTAFRNPKYFIISVIAAVLTFFFYPLIIEGSSISTNKISFGIFNKIYNKTFIVKKIIFICDTIGLGVFTALGSNIAIEYNMNNLFTVVCMGMISGVGGGLLRDIFVREIPLVLKKEIYAVASVSGGIVLYFVYNYISPTTSLYICFFVTFILRVLAVKYNLNLPIVKSTKEMKGSQIIEFDVS